MPSYHSKFNQVECDKICGIPMLQFRKKSSPVLDPKKLSSSPDGSFDIIDEAIIYFRSNIFFKNFPIEGDSDKLIVYLTVFIQKILEKANIPDMNKAKNIVKSLVDGCEYVKESQNFFNLLITDDKNPASYTALKKYLRELRTETVERMVNILFDNPETTLDRRFWLALGKKRFLAYEMPCSIK